MAVPLIINGQDVLSTERFEVVSPDTRETLWSCSSATRELADAAVAAAAAAFPAWSSTKASVRRAIFLRVADILESRTPELQQCMAQEIGAVQPFLSVNTSLSAELLRDLAGRISSALSGKIPVCEEDGTHALVVREPYGVVLGIAPW
jgi:acyl-CoA reductase-like NAD-dependent aldehyde dehydrogenase